MKCAKCGAVQKEGKKHGIGFGWKIGIVVMKSERGVRRNVDFLTAGV